ncbi:PREDICTED: RNA polymerase II-associated protein 3-like isoform X2 [Priapulus caudatus]|uniref:RNA polymerase II-associated protein 3 n=1 Tax=Priapulus caudatus TaxID=37621 RepID=A0ABM1EE00_PRICU|nr:PREDICTED: RNA polymerase II-associated protein 3-like isoform X2 [Priapulus caudatus]
MSKFNMLECQQQVKENSLELNDYLRELEKWETDVKKKDDKLRTSQPLANKLPPVRNEAKRQKRKKPQSSENKKEKPQPIKSYNYSAWDKFDVEKACQDIDQGADQQSSEEDDDSADNERQEMEWRVQQAVAEKDLGNDLFKKAKYEEAIEHYTKGIGYDQFSAILPANRAMALLKLGRYAAAEADASTSIGLDPTYVKAYARRGTARLARKCLAEARLDFEQVLTLEPDNRQAKADILKIENFLEKSKPTPDLEESQPEKADEGRLSKKLPAKLDVVPGLVMPIDKSVHLRSKKPLTRISIDEYDEDEHISLVETEKPPETSQTKQATAGDRLAVSSGSDNRVTGMSSPSGSVDGVHRQSSKVDVVIGDESRQDRARTTVTGSINKDEGTADVAEDDGPPLPANSVQLQLDWRRLKGNSSKLYKYFKRIQPADYPRLFSQFLEADVLSQIIAVLRDFYVCEKEDVFSVLAGLVHVARFSTIAMFMGSTETKALNALFERVKQSGLHSKEDVAAVSLKYNLS